MIIQGREIKVAAIDFDGTLFTEDKFPAVGTPIIQNIEYVKNLKENGVELILYTNREGQLLEDAVEACKSVGLTFDAVNQNLQWRIDLYGNDCRKIGADIYIDDKAMNAAELDPSYSFHEIVSCKEYTDSMLKNRFFNLAINNIIKKRWTVVGAIYQLAKKLDEIETSNMRHEIWKLLQEVDQ